MKYPVRELFIPLLMVLEFMFSSPLFSSSQSKVLKLKVENQAIGLPVTRNYSQKLVKTISIYGSRGLDELITFDYDAQNRVSSLTMEGDGNISALPENCTLYFEMNGNILNLYGSSSDIPKVQLYTCIINEFGYITEEVDLSGLEDKSIYEYDSEGQTLVAKFGNSHANYEWKAGNIYVTKYPFGTESYTYTNIVNKANINFNALMRETYLEDMWGFALCGYIGNKDINLMSTYGSLKYEYEFDSDGYVKMIREGSKTYVISYDGDAPIDPDPTPSDPTTDEELEEVIENAPEGTEDNPTEIFIPSDGITLNKPIDIDKHIRLKGGSIVRGNGNSYALLRVREGYSLDLDGITIDGRDKDQKDGALVVYGKLRLREGTILKNCYRSEINTPSGVICVGDKGYVRMDDGVKIMDNIGSYGSAVYCEGMFEMYGGEISGNKAQIGTIVMNVGGVFKMHGGKIVRNGTSEGCGGVFIGEDSQCWIYNGEISENEDCDIYSWSDIFSGSNANVEGAVWLTEGNKLQIIDRLKYNWNIAFVNDPIPGTIVASGYMGFSLNNIDLQHVHYLNNAYSLLLKGNDILISKEATSTEKIVSENSQIRILDQTVYIENFSSNTRFIVYSMDGKLCLSGQTDTNGRASFFIPKGFYLLKDEKMTYKFFVR